MPLIVANFQHFLYLKFIHIELSELCSQDLFQGIRYEVRGNENKEFDLGGGLEEHLKLRVCFGYIIPALFQHTIKGQNDLGGMYYPCYWASKGLSDKTPSVADLETVCGLCLRDYRSHP